MARTPTNNMVTAAKSTRTRLLSELKGKKGVDATRQRLAINAIFALIDRLVAGTLPHSVEPPNSIERNPQSAIERKVVRFWKAFERLQEWSMGSDRTLREADVVGAFDAII